MAQESDGIRGGEDRCMKEAFFSYEPGYKSKKNFEYFNLHYVDFTNDPTDVIWLVVLQNNVRDFTKHWKVKDVDPVNIGKQYSMAQIKKKRLGVRKGGHYYYVGIKWTYPELMAPMYYEYKDRKHMDVREPWRNDGSLPGPLAWDGHLDFFPEKRHYQDNNAYILPKPLRPPRKRQLKKPNNPNKPNKPRKPKNVFRYKGKPIYLPFPKKLNPNTPCLVKLRQFLERREKAAFATLCQQYLLNGSSTMVVTNTDGWKITVTLGTSNAKFRPADPKPNRPKKVWSFPYLEEALRSASSIKWDNMLASKNCKGNLTWMNHGTKEPVQNLPSENEKKHSQKHNRIAFKKLPSQRPPSNNNMDTTHWEQYMQDGREDWLEDSSDSDSNRVTEFSCDVDIVNEKTGSDYTNIKTHSEETVQEKDKYIVKTNLYPSERNNGSDLDNASNKLKVDLNESDSSNSDDEDASTKPRAPVISGFNKYWYRHKNVNLSESSDDSDSDDSLSTKPKEAKLHVKPSTKHKLNSYSSKPSQVIVSKPSYVAPPLHNKPRTTFKITTISGKVQKKKQRKVTKQTVDKHLKRLHKKFSLQYFIKRPRANEATLKSEEKQPTKCKQKPTANKPRNISNLMKKLSMEECEQSPPSENEKKHSRKPKPTAIKNLPSQRPPINNNIDPIRWEKYMQDGREDSSDSDSNRANNDSDSSGWITNISNGDPDRAHDCTDSTGTGSCSGLDIVNENTESDYTDIITHCEKGVADKYFDIFKNYLYQSESSDGSDVDDASIKLNVDLNDSDSSNLDDEPVIPYMYRYGYLNLRESSDDSDFDDGPSTKSKEAKPHVKLSTENVNLSGNSNSSKTVNDTCSKPVAPTDDGSTNYKDLNWGTNREISGSHKGPSVECRNPKVTKSMAKKTESISLSVAPRKRQLSDSTKTMLSPPIKKMKNTFVKTCARSSECFYMDMSKMDDICCRDLSINNILLYHSSWTDIDNSDSECSFSEDSGSIVSDDANSNLDSSSSIDDSSCMYEDMFISDSDSFSECSDDANSNSESSSWDCTEDFTVQHCFLYEVGDYSESYDSDDGSSTKSKEANPHVKPSFVNQLNTEPEIENLLKSLSLTPDKESQPIVSKPSLAIILPYNTLEPSNPSQVLAPLRKRKKKLPCVQPKWKCLFLCSMFLCSMCLSIYMFYHATESSTS